MSCLYVSLSHYLRMSPDEVRQKVVDALEKAADEVVDDLSVRSAVEIAERVPFERYARGMRSPSTWGGGIELEFAAREFDLKIVVHGPGRSVMSIGEGRTEIALRYDGSHYRHW